MKRIETKTPPADPIGSNGPRRGAAMRRALATVAAAVGTGSQLLADVPPEESVIGVSGLRTVLAAVGVGVVLLVVAIVILKGRNEKA